MSAGRIGALDGWRAVSAALVIVSHLFFGTFDGLGNLGVQIFFVISGFVICRSLIREKAATGAVSLVGFYVRRGLRILPPLAFYVGSIALLSRLDFVSDYSAGVIRALTFTCNFRNAGCGGWLGAHTWSLSAEEQFYLLIPAAFSMFGRFRRAALSVAAICLPLIVLAMYAFQLGVYAKFLAEFVSIGFGVACALNEATVRRFAKNISSPGAWIAVSCMIGISLFSGSRTATAIQVIFLAPLIAALLFRTIEATSPLEKFLNSRVASVVGKASYTLYLWQQLATFPAVSGYIWISIWALAACILFSLASFYLVENRLIELGRKRSERLSRTPIDDVKAVRAGS